MASTFRNTQILGDTDRDQSLFARNNMRTDYPRDSSIQQLFEEQTERRPHAIALKFGDEQISYRQLNERANQVAHRLREMGVGRETMVSTRLERSPAMLVGILGILKAGGAFVPLDATYPAERLALMAADTKAPVMVAQRSVLNRVANQNWSTASLVVLDEGTGEIGRQSKKNPENITSAEDLAYVMYTSGSTGKPKGVMVNHRAVIRLVKNTNYIELSEQEVFLQFSPISFDASTLEIWAPLLNGGILAIASPDVVSLEEIGVSIRRFGVTTAWLTAGLFNLMVEQRLEDLRPLRQLVVGGDALSPVHVRKAMEGLPGCRLINGYGPTENTTFTCCHAITSDDLQRPSIPIGRPIANTQVYLLDAKDELVGVGEEGELCIGGDGLARGYLNQPELTAEKFVQHPHATNPGERIYKTGDLVRYRADGAIEFIGRADHQVKINGYRIELGEIETALMQYSDVRSAIVLARQDVPGEKKLVAYIVSQPGGCPIGELRAFMQRKLPPYMLPSAFVMLNALPLSPNGKIDRGALPAPRTTQSEENNVPVTQEANVELTIAGVWQRVLGVKQIGLNDNFFDVGGDSLQLLEAHAELQKLISADLLITDLFEHSTVKGLAQFVNGKKGGSGILDAQERARKQQRAWARQKPSRADQIS